MNRVTVVLCVSMLTLFGTVQAQEESVPEQTYELKTSVASGLLIIQEGALINPNPTAVLSLSGKTSDGLVFGVMGNQTLAGDEDINHDLRLWIGGNMELGTLEWKGRVFVVDRRQLFTWRADDYWGMSLEIERPWHLGDHRLSPYIEIERLMPFEFTTEQRAGWIGSVGIGDRWQFDPEAAIEARIGLAHNSRVLEFESTTFQQFELTIDIGKPQEAFHLYLPKIQHINVDERLGDGRRDATVASIEAVYRF